MFVLLLWNLGGIPYLWATIITKHLTVCLVYTGLFCGKRLLNHVSFLLLFLGSPDSQTKVFPQDKVILVGSDVIVCCVTRDNVSSAQIGLTKCPLIHLDGKNVAIKIHNISVSASSGTNVVFTTEDNIYGTVLFAGCKYIILRKVFLLICFHPLWKPLCFF